MINAPVSRVHVQMGSDDPDVLSHAFVARSFSYKRFMLVDAAKFLLLTNEHTEP